VVLPFETSGGHFAEITLREKLDDHYEVTYLGGGVGDLFLAGVSLSRAQETAKAAAEEFGLVLDSAENRFLTQVPRTKGSEPAGWAGSSGSR